MPSPVWEFFQKMSNSSLCITCGKLVSSTNTTNMWYHLEKYHGKFFADLKKKPSENEKKLECSSTEGNTSTVVANDSTIVGQHDSEDSGDTIGVQPDPVLANSNVQPVVDSETKKISPTSTTPAPDKSMVQTVLGNRFVKTSKAQTEKITMAIAYFIAVACLAYSIVENIGFRYLMKILAPNYHVPSRKVFSHDRVPKLYQSTKKKIVEELTQADHFAITTDGWTSSNSHKFIAVTVSFINESWKLVSRTLACRDLNISNTGENIKCLIENVLDEYKIKKSEVVAGVSDRGPNCVLAIQLLGFDHVPCFAHAVNTKMEEMLKLKFIAPTLAKIKDIYNTLSRSNIAKNFLESCQKSLGLSTLKMPSSCETRWWSETKQFRFVIDNEMALYKFVTTYPGMDQKNLLTPDDIARIKAILLVMDSMQKYVTTLGSETVTTASMIVPLIHKLDKVFNKFKFNDVIASFEIKKFFRETPKFFEELFLKEKSLLEITTYLDPRFKDGRRLDLEVILKQEIRELKDKSQEKPNSSMEKKKVKMTALEELFEESDDDINVLDVAQHEIDLYNSQLKIPITENPLIWWKNRVTVFPYLSVIAKKYLCIPATSVLSERVFSSGGKVITKEKSRITDEHAEELICLHMNKDIVPHS